MGIALPALGCQVRTKAKPGTWASQLKCLVKAASATASLPSESPAQNGGSRFAKQTAAATWATGQNPNRSPSEHSRGPFPF